MKLSILIPAYNEQENIKRLYAELIPVMDDIEKRYTMNTELVLVNDGSTDKTLDIMNLLAKKDMRTRLITYTPNRGIGHALRVGIKTLHSDWTVMLDADLTFHPTEITKLLDVMNSADFICGSPFMEGGKTQDVPLYRKILTTLVVLMYRVAIGKKVKAITPIFKLYKTKNLKDLKLRSGGFTIFAEILSKLIFKRKTFMEVPVTLTARKHGQSKMKFFKEIKNNLKMFFLILAWRVKYWFIYRNTKQHETHTLQETV